MKKLLSLLAITGVVSFNSNLVVSCQGRGTIGKVDFPKTFKIRSVYKGSYLYESVRDEIAIQTVDAKGNQIFADKDEVREDPNLILRIKSDDGKLLKETDVAKKGESYNAFISIANSDPKLNPMPENKYVFDGSGEPVPGKKVDLPRYPSFTIDMQSHPNHKVVYMDARLEVAYLSEGRYLTPDAVKDDFSISVIIYNADGFWYREDSTFAKQGEVLTVKVTTNDDNEFYNTDESDFKILISY